MEVDYCVVSIGALSRNRLWDEMDQKRTSHATTTVIRDDSKTILVDPSLPAELLQQRLDERTGLRPDEIDIVFLTNFRPVHRRALAMFEGATWVMHQPEIASFQAHLQEMEDHLQPDERDVEALIAGEQALLNRCQPAGEKLTAHVHLYPAIGVTPGSAGLLLASTSRTTIVAGDAVLTQGYFQAGRVFEQCTDLEQARSSFSDIMEIADEIIPGHDNVFRVYGR